MSEFTGFLLPDSLKDINESPHRSLRYLHQIETQYRKQTLIYKDVSSVRSLQKCFYVEYP